MLPVGGVFAVTVSNASLLNTALKSFNTSQRNSAPLSPG